MLELPCLDRGTQARLTPLYDLASALVVPDYNWHKWDLAMKVGGEGRLKYLTLRHWQKEADLLGIDRDTMTTWITDTAARLPDALADAINTKTTKALKSTMPATLLDAVTDNVSRLQKLWR